MPAATLFAAPGYSVFRDAAAVPVALGRGAWGETWKAFHHGLQCHAAVKIIPHSRFAAEGAREQFLSVLRGAARLRHPHLATVFPPVGAGGAIWYARELAEGEPLPAWLRRRAPLGAREALRMISQLAAALAVGAAAGLHPRRPARRECARFRG